jgi:hypothetical protein
VLFQLFQTFVIPSRVTEALWDTVPTLIIAFAGLLLAAIRSATNRIMSSLEETRALHCANRQLLLQTQAEVEETRRQLQGEPARRHGPRTDVEATQ